MPSLEPLLNAARECGRYGRKGCELFKVLLWLLSNAGHWTRQGSCSRTGCDDASRRDELIRRFGARRHLTAPYTMDSEHA